MLETEKKLDSEMLRFLSLFSNPHPTIKITISNDQK